MATYNIYEMDNILRLIGIQLGEDSVNGVRFSREMKLLWLGLEQLHLSLVLPESILKELTVITTHSLDVGSNEIAIDETDLDYLVGVDYDITGDGDYRRCDMVSKTEMQRILEDYEDDEDVDTTENMIAVSAEHPKCAVMEDVSEWDGKNPAQRSFKLKFMPEPESSDTASIRKIYMKFPETISYTTDWDTPGSVGITLHKRLILALINGCIMHGKTADKAFEEALYFERQRDKQIKEIRRKYVSNNSDTFMTVKIPRML